MRASPCGSRLSGDVTPPPTTPQLVADPLREVDEQPGVEPDGAGQESHLADGVVVGVRLRLAAGHQPERLVDDRRDCRVTRRRAREVVLKGHLPVPVHVRVHAEDQDMMRFVGNAQLVPNRCLEVAHCCNS